MTAELPEFLRARLGEREQALRALAEARSVFAELPELARGPMLLIQAAVPDGREQQALRELLVDIEVKRQIIAMHEHDHSCVDAVGMDDYAFTGPPHHIHCITLRLLALPYAAHPDYRPEWAPDAVVTMTDTPHAPQRERLGETRVMAVLCSDGPENGARVELSGTAVGALEIGHERRVFRWDGTYDDHGDARYRPS